MFINHGFSSFMKKTHFEHEVVEFMVVLFENLENGEDLKILKTEDKDSVNKRSAYEYTYACAYQRLGVRGNACCLMDYAAKRKVLWVELCPPKIQM